MQNYEKLCQEYFNDPYRKKENQESIELFNKVMSIIDEPDSFVSMNVIVCVLGALVEPTKDDESYTIKLISRKLRHVFDLKKSLTMGQ